MAVDVRARFTDTMISTASQNRLVTMVYDRLLRDVRHALAAVEQGDTAEVHQSLVHAQELLSALDQGLDETQWPGVRDLHRLYDYVGRRMVAGNVTKSAAPLRECLAILEPLAAAWHEAYRRAASS